MIYETYVCAKAGDQIEYGFTFKEHPDDDDSVEDLIVGTTTDGTIVEAELEKNEYRAQARLQEIHALAEWQATAQILT